ncbi:MAG: hypothetical protein JWN72_848 [Thermoleophilia bacterium]|nr:hypothetical protein [Thermoleophilia bacterium]
MPPSDFHDQHGGDRFPPPSTPRKVAGGIRLQARGRQPVGTTWWARRWLASLEALGIGERLERGRDYARGGQVMTLDVDVSGVVSAKVQGTRLTPYAARIEAQPFTQLEWLGLADAFAAQANFRAQLLAGVMPDDAEAIFARAGLRLFPTTDDDLHFSCTCADWATPCRHVAAACYLVGEAFDRDPLLLLRLRGIEAPLLLELLASRDGSTGGGAPRGDAERAVGAPATPAGPAGTEPAVDSVQFWSVPGSEQQPRLDLTPPPADAPLVRILGAVPFWRGLDDFEPTMRTLYARLRGDGVALDVALDVMLDAALDGAPEGALGRGPDTLGT